MQPFNTRVVVPLLPLEDAPKPAATLNPLFDIDGVEHVMVTQYMAASISELKRERNVVYAAAAKR